MTAQSIACGARSGCLTCDMYHAIDGKILSKGHHALTNVGVRSFSQDNVYTSHRKEGLRKSSMKWKESRSWPHPAYNSDAPSSDYGPPPLMEHFLREHDPDI
ncbi:hypothetical protein KIN20_016429 [Parelaphostrongylus tenuis]|uniref:Uncharacterized protein n=1 Tax=Parelaphostrongylus tenuis TaxID=148309 RepID=A0AAD5MLI8_PARTN|nr:hypothetical protein KIN20_016429 [Parelaphostrongylus tenuis]